VTIAIAPRTPALRVSYTGDSLVRQLVPTWPDYVPSYSTHLATSTSAINYGVSGERASLMVTHYSVEGHVNRPTPGIDAGWSFLHGGGNDLVDGVSPATVYGYLSSLWASARLDGYTVVALTVNPRANWGAGSVANWNALNALILGDATRYDYVARPDLTLPDPNDATKYIDTTHPTVLGAQLIAQAVVTTIGQ